MPLGELVAWHGVRCDHRRRIGEIVADENLAFGATWLDDAPDATVRDGTAEKGDFALPRQQHVGYEVAAAVQMAHVLLALESGSDALRHNSIPVQSQGGRRRNFCRIEAELR
jgi:hypothetical protein